MHTRVKVRYIVHFVPSHRPNDTNNNVNYFIKAFYLNGDLNNDGFLILASSSSPENYDSSGETRANDTSSE